MASAYQTKNQKSKLAEKEALQQRMADDYCSGMTQQKIAVKYGYTQARVSQIIADIRLTWKAKMLVDFDDKVNEEIAKIDRLENIANAQLLKSCEDQEEVNDRVKKVLKEKPLKEAASGKSKNGKSNKTLVEALAKGESELTIIEEVSTRKTRGQSGNQAWATTVAWCIETRLKLLGLLKNDSQKTDVNVNIINWQPVVQQLPPEGMPVRDATAEEIRMLEHSSQVPVVIEPVKELADA